MAVPLQTLPLQSYMHKESNHCGPVPSPEKTASLPAQVSYSMPSVFGKEFRYLLFATALILTSLQAASEATALGVSAAAMWGLGVSLFGHI